MELPESNRSLSSSVPNRPFLSSYTPNRPHSQNGFRSSSIYSQNQKIPRTRSLSVSSPPKNGTSSAILFRDSRGEPALQPIAAFFKEGIGGVMEDDIANFFKCYTCYDCIPKSAKLVILDTKLMVKKAFYAMVDTGVRACPLWDSERQEFIGMLTITDFIRILQNNYQGRGAEMKAFEDQMLCDVKGVNKEDPSNVYHMAPESSLFDAASMLIKNKIHRLPIVDPKGNVINIMTQKPLLKFLYQFFPKLDQVAMLHKSIRQAGVGTLADIKVATKETKVIDALNEFVEWRISALPIVDDQGKLVHIYSKFDVINLAAEKSYANLDITLEDATSHKSEFFDGVHTCTAEESLYTVIERLVKTDVARLVLVDEMERVKGIVTVSDIICFLIESNKPTRSKIIRNTSAAVRVDSIGEEFDDLDLSSCEDIPVSQHSCSPPRWFQV